MKNFLILLGVTIILSVISTPVSAEELLTLQQAWIQAYQNNPSLESERAKLRATDESVAQAVSHWRPTADVSANIGKTYQHIPAQKPLGTDNFADTSRGYNVQVTQPVFRGFRTVAETEAAEKEVLSGRAKLQSAEQQLLLDTATAFLDTFRDEIVLNFDKENEDVLHKKLKETEIRAKVGDQTQTDVRQAESRLARAEVARLQTENDLTKDRTALGRLIGDTPGGLKQPQLAMDQGDDLADLFHRSETRNPSVVAAQYSEEEAKAEIELNEGSLLPEVNLVGSRSSNWGQNSSFPGQLDSSTIMAQVTIPLYHGGADYSKVRAASQVAMQRRMELEEARHRAHEAVDNAWKALSVSHAAIKADQREVDSAKRAYEGVKVEHRVGTRTTLDVLNAEQELLDAKIDLARSEHDRDVAMLQIKSAVGEFTADALKLPLETYDPKHHYDDVRGSWIGFGDSEDDVYSSRYKNKSAD